MEVIKARAESYYFYMCYIPCCFRAIYFSVYAKMKKYIKSTKLVKKDSPFIPLVAGACAGMYSVFS